jgi:uncharacterized protein (TIGR02271 family)
MREDSRADEIEPRAKNANYKRNNNYMLLLTQVPRRTEEMKRRYPSAETKIPIHEEELRLEKREITRRKVRVRTEVETIDEVARATLKEDVVEVERIAIGNVVESPPAIRTEGDLTIIPVLEEVLFVEKRLVLVEEIHVRRSTKQEEVAVPVKLRKQRAVVDAGDAAAAATRKKQDIEHDI